MGEDYSTLFFPSIFPLHLRVHIHDDESGFTKTIGHGYQIFDDH